VFFDVETWSEDAWGMDGYKRVLPGGRCLIDEISGPVN
jgi:hypothetical protein